MRDARRILRDCGAGKLLPKELLAFMEDFTVEDVNLRVDRSGSEHVCIKAFASIQGTLVRIEVDHARRGRSDEHDQTAVPIVRRADHWGARDPVCSLWR